MTPQDIINEIEKAKAGDRTLMIAGYKTSDGAVKDYVVELLPTDGYKELVRKSGSDLLEKRAQLAEELIPEASEEVQQQYDAAVAELHASFLGSLDGNKPVKDIQYKNPTVKQGSVYLYNSEVEQGNIQTVIVKNLLIKSSTTRVASDKEVKESKNPVVNFKNKIKSKLPVSRYLPQLNLAPDKVELVRSLVMEAR